MLKEVMMREIRRQGGKGYARPSYIGAFLPSYSPVVAEIVKVIMQASRSWPAGTGT
jgi:hypothetical protein